MSTCQWLRRRQVSDASWDMGRESDVTGRIVSKGERDGTGPGGFLGSYGERASAGGASG